MRCLKLTRLFILAGDHQAPRPGVTFLPGCFGPAGPAFRAQNPAPVTAPPPPRTAGALPARCQSGQALQLRSVGPLLS